MAIEYCLQEIPSMDVLLYDQTFYIFIKKLYSYLFSLFFFEPADSEALF